MKSQVEKVHRGRKFATAEESPSSLSTTINDDDSNFLKVLLSPATTPDVQSSGTAQGRLSEVRRLNLFRIWCRRRWSRMLRMLIPSFLSFVHKILITTMMNRLTSSSATNWMSINREKERSLDEARLTVHFSNICKAQQKLREYRKQWRDDDGQCTHDETPGEMAKTLSLSGTGDKGADEEEKAMTTRWSVRQTETEMGNQWNWTVRWPLGVI